MELWQQAIGHTESLIGQIDEFLVPDSQEHPQIVEAIQESLIAIRERSNVLLDVMSFGMRGAIDFDASDLQDDEKQEEKVKKEKVKKENGKI